jgi:hypothetical protein
VSKKVKMKERERQRESEREREREGEKERWSRSRHCLYNCNISLHIFHFQLLIVQIIN